MTDPGRRSKPFDSYKNAAVIVSGVDAEQLGDPTRCPKYDVAGLIDHVVEAGHRAAALDRGHAPRPGKVPRVQLSDAPGQLRRAAEEAQQSLGRRVQIVVEVHHAMGRGVHGSHSGGHVPGRDGRRHLGLNPSDRTARQVGPSIAAPALEGARAMIKPQYRDMVEPGAPFGAEVPPPAGEGDWERRRLHGTRPTGIARSVGRRGGSVAIVPK